MLKFLCAGKPTSFNGSIYDSLNYVKKIGLNGMEVEFVRNIYMTKEKALDFGKKAKKLKLFLTCHAPYYLNLNSKDKLKLKASMERIFQTNKIANFLGAKRVVFHPGFYMKDSPKIAYENILNNLSKIIDRIKSHNYAVLLSPENMGSKSKFGSVDEILDLHKDLGINVCLDFAHVHARTNGGLKTIDDFKNLLKKFPKKLLKNLHCHITCVEYGSKGEKHHLPLKTKKPDYTLLAKAIKEMKLNNLSFTSESPLNEKDALKFKKMF